MLTAPRTFAALADPTRLRVLALLRAMELSVGEIAQVLGQSQPRVSRHVKILAEAGLVERRKEGSWVFLSLGARDRMEPLFALFDRWAEQDGPQYANPRADMAAQAAPAEPAPAAAAAPDPIAQLKELGELHQSGVLTDEEFAAQKAKILGS